MVLDVHVHSTEVELSIGEESSAWVLRSCTGRFHPVRSGDFYE
jgi:hypothetical protein